MKKVSGILVLVAIVLACVILIINPMEVEAISESIDEQGIQYVKGADDVLYMDSELDINDKLLFDESDSLDMPENKDDTSSSTTSTTTTATSGTVKEAEKESPVGKYIVIAVIVVALIGLIIFIEKKHK